MGTLENLLHHVHDPKAVFKSLSTSENPNSYTVVLNAKAKNEKPIIAILSPSKFLEGYTFIPTVFERNNFEKFIDRIHEEQNALYIKENGSELWGRQQSPPLHNSEPYIKNILTKDDVVKLINEKNLSQNKEKVTENLAYGESGNRAWEQNLYLKGKAAEIRAARQSQHENAMEMVQGLKQINSKEKNMENENQDARQVEEEVKSSGKLLQKMNFKDKEGELSLEDKLSLYVSLHGKEAFFNLSDKIVSLHEEQKQLDQFPDLNDEQFFEGLFEIEKSLENVQKEKSMENENQGTAQVKSDWKLISFGDKDVQHEILNHTFSNEQGSQEAIFVIEKSNNGVSLINFENNQDMQHWLDQGSPGAEAYLLPPDKSIADAKELTTDIIKHFDNALANNLKRPDGEEITPSTIIHDLNDHITNCVYTLNQEYTPQPEIGKETTQSPTQAESLSKRSQEESYYLHNALKQRDTILDSLESGTSACLPRQDGYADTTPAVNLINNTTYHSSTLLYLKEHQRANGYPTAEYLTADQINEARAENKAIGIRKGEKGVVINISTYNKETGEYDKSNVRLFNVAQTAKPDLLREYAGKVQEERAEKALEYMQSKHGTSYKPPEKKASPPEIVCTSTEPSKYLAQYLAAVSMGSKFKVSEEQAKEFSKNFDEKVMEKGENGYPNPFKLSMVCNQASKECKDIKAMHLQEQNIDKERSQKEMKKDVDIDR